MWSDDINDPTSGLFTPCPCCPQPCIHPQHIIHSSNTAEMPPRAKKIQVKGSKIPTPAGSHYSCAQTNTSTGSGAFTLYFSTPQLQRYHSMMRSLQNLHSQLYCLSARKIHPLKISQILRCGNWMMRKLLVSNK